MAKITLLLKGGSRSFLLVDEARILTAPRLRPKYHFREL
jgi:hypothetical protein